MIVYHGSNSCFKTLRIHKSLVKHDSTLLNEGMGIYFSTNIEVARSYGKYLYTISIEDGYFKDFRSKKVCQDYVKELIKHVHNKEKINLLDYMDARSLVEYMYYGGIAIYNLGREISLLLDANEKWYIDTFESKRNKVYGLVSSFGKNNLHAYMFNYNIKDIGIIKNVDVANILKREARY